MGFARALGWLPGALRRPDGVRVASHVRVWWLACMARRALKLFATKALG
jgi:hypothetical protein